MDTVSTSHVLFTVFGPSPRWIARAANALGVCERRIRYILEDTRGIVAFTPRQRSILAAVCRSRIHNGKRERENAVKAIERHHAIGAAVMRELDRIPSRN